MSDLLDRPNVTEASHPVRSERRRPGRTKDISPNLIPLLRGGNEPSPGQEEQRDSDLAPATGIAVSVIISGLMWAILIWII
jgi:hypothetical protein